ncbi:unnamed protein product, partial [Rotaria sp. Silwood1]
MPKSTRSNLNLHTTSISEFQYKSSRQQVKGELSLQIDPITTMSTAHYIAELDDDPKNQVIDSVRLSQEYIETFRELEQQRLNSIKLLTEEEMINIDQYLLNLQNIYELRYSNLFRVQYSTTHFQEKEKIPYEQHKKEINGGWLCFCNKLKQYVYNRLKIGIDYARKDHASLSLHELVQLRQLIRDKFTKYSGNGDAEMWLAKTVTQFKQYQLLPSEQL